MFHDETTAAAPAETTTDYPLTGTTTIGYDPPATQGWGAGVAYQPNTTLAWHEPARFCNRDTHYFECKHEAVCICGSTYRTPPVKLEMPPGL